LVADPAITLVDVHQVIRQALMTVVAVPASQPAEAAVGRLVV
jgi:hypothetical protein